MPDGEWRRTKPGGWRSVRDLPTARGEVQPACRLHGHILQELLEAARLHLGMEVTFSYPGWAHGAWTSLYVDNPGQLDICQVGSSAPFGESWPGTGYERNGIGAGD